MRKGYLTKIPAMSISYADAIPILTALNGQGPSASDIGERWHGGGLGVYGVHYNVGPSTNNISPNMMSNAAFNRGKVTQRNCYHPRISL
jgi:N-acetylated-alpha-linked acidic dipeptidase